MPQLPRFRSVLSRLVVLVVVPLSLVLFGVILVSLVAYQQILTSLLVDRDRQLATLIAARVSESVDGDARLLATLANASYLQNQTPETWTAALAKASGTLDVFNAGVVVVAQDGQTLVTNVPGASPVDQTVADQDYFKLVRERRQAVFSHVLPHAHTGQNLVIVAVPVFDEQQNFEGALLGAMYLAGTPLAASIQQLTIGQGGMAYVVDGQGRVVFHPDAANLGLDFTDRPFVKNVMAGESGGTLWTAPTGERLVLGYTPIGATGWGLIVREPWEVVSAPARAYSVGTLLAGLAAVAAAGYFLWRGVLDITTPLRGLAQQTSRLAAGETVEPIAPSPIQEIDRLGRDFNRMAAQVATYRAGLRRYVGALTQGQEEERRRLARDLHDETVQGLLVMTRRLELCQTAEDIPERLRQQLAELQGTLADTLRGVRRISRDLRPLALDDLGLIPALRMLVGAAHSGPGAVPQAEFIVSGQPRPLTPAQELALYRIAQEALNNIRKHARATGVRVDLTFEAAAACLDVVDDGIGFVMPDALASLTQNNHFGLMGMQERAWGVGGTLAVQSKPGKGARLRVTVPLEARA